MSANRPIMDTRYREAALNLLFFANNPRQSIPVVPPAGTSVPGPGETSDEEAILLPSNMPPKRLRSRSPRTPSVSTKRRRLDSPDSDSSMEDAIELSVPATPIQLGGPSARAHRTGSVMSSIAPNASSAQNVSLLQAMREKDTPNLSVVVAVAAAAAQQAVLAIRRRKTDSTISDAGNGNHSTSDKTTAGAVSRKNKPPHSQSSATAQAATSTQVATVRDITAQDAFEQTVTTQAPTTQVSCPSAGATYQPLLETPPAHICRCWNGTQPAPKLDWERFGITPVPKVDEPFLCTRCKIHWTHHAGRCSMMKGFPWILPSMEKDYMCFACWNSLAHGVRQTYEDYFFKKHAAKFGFVEVPLDVQKYMDMHEEIVGWKWENNRWVEGW